MRHGFILPLAIIFSVAIGGLLFLYGGAAFTSPKSPFSSAPSTSGIGKSNADFSVLAEGKNAPGIDERVNYRITNADEFAALWQMLYSTNGDVVPNVDFSKNEVLAIFDGSHSTGGYGVRINSVKDVDGARAIDLTYLEPSGSCSASNDSTSPFVLIEVKKTSLPLSRQEHTETSPCN